MTSHIRTKLEPADYINAAKVIGCEPEAVYAIAKVESSGAGFIEVDGYGLVPLINFEAQWFRRYTHGKYDQSHPDISYPQMDRKFGEGEWKRFSEAAALDRDAALKSTSWGLFQVMGFNHKICGWDTVEEFVADMHKDIYYHLKAFSYFVMNKGLVKVINAHNWEEVARVYNGPNYAINKYDERIKNFYEKAKKEKLFEG